MTDQELRLVLQVALLGEVGPALRAVAFERHRDKVTIRFYVDGQIAIRDRESASCVVSEVTAAMPEHVRVTDEVIRCDMPAAIKDDGMMVFRRREWT